jgi:hypothetical protein
MSFSIDFGFVIGPFEAVFAILCLGLETSITTSSQTTLGIFVCVTVLNLRAINFDTVTLLIAISHVDFVFKAFNDFTFTFTVSFLVDWAFLTWAQCSLSI